MISPTLAGCLLRDHGRRGAIDDAAAQPLSSRECEVLRLLAEGHTDGEVCHQLHISPRTVQTDLACIRAKTRLRRRFAAVEPGQRARRSLRSPVTPPGA